MHLNPSPLYNPAAAICHCSKKLDTPDAMNRRPQIAARSFKEELIFDEELAEGGDNEDADEDYDVDSLLNIRPVDYVCGRRSVSLSVSAPFAHESGSSSSTTGWMPIPQHQLPPRAPQPMSICQVENCMADMSNAKQYHKRHKVCEFHAKAQFAVVAGLQQRFCQQCSR